MLKLLQTTMLLFVLIFANGQDEERKPFTTPTANHSEDTTKTEGKANPPLLTTITFDNEIFHKYYVFRGKIAFEKVVHPHCELAADVGLTSEPAGVQLIITPMYVLEKHEVLVFKIGAGTGFRLPAMVPIFETVMQIHFKRLHIEHALEWVPNYFIKRTKLRPIEKLYTKNNVYYDVYDRSQHAVSFGSTATHEWTGLLFHYKWKNIIRLWACPIARYEIEDDEEFAHRLGADVGASFTF